VREASGDLVGFHGTDPTSVYLAAWARVRDFEVPDLEHALYDGRELLKILGMRRTMFVVPRDLAGIIQSACTEAIAARERARLVRMLRDAGIADDPVRWLARVEDETMDALHRSGEATASELTREVAGLRERIRFGIGRKWDGEVGVSTRVLFLLSSEGRIIRGRPRGTLVSSLYRWVPMDGWLGGELEVWPKAEAQAELVRRYLGTFGPATRVDVQWWTGWTVAETKRALDAVGAREIDVAARDDARERAWALPDWTPPRPPDAPWVALLGSLDATPMGWQERAWFLGPHKARMFDRAGNVGPSIWLDDRIVGGWAQRRDGEIRWQLLEDVGADATAMIEARVEALRTWLGPLRFVPRFRTPVEQELSG
jgi:Winged helix DNA-binding domain